MSTSCWPQIPPNAIQAMYGHTRMADGINTTSMWGRTNDGLDKHLLRVGLLGTDDRHARLAMAELANYAPILSFSSKKGYRLAIIRQRSWKRGSTRPSRGHRAHSTRARISHRQHQSQDEASHSRQKGHRGLNRKGGVTPSLFYSLSIRKSN